MSKFLNDKSYLCHLFIHAFLFFKVAAPSCDLFSLYFTTILVDIFWKPLKLIELSAKIFVLELESLNFRKPLQIQNRYQLLQRTCESGVKNLTLFSSARSRPLLTGLPSWLQYFSVWHLCPAFAKWTIWAILNHLTDDPFWPWVSPTPFHIPITLVYCMQLNANCETVWEPSLFNNC